MSADKIIGGPAHAARVAQLQRTGRRALVRLLAQLEQGRGVAVLFRACPINELSTDELIRDICEAEGFHSESHQLGR